MLFSKKNIFITILAVSILCSSYCNGQSGNIYTFAGNGTAGFSGDGGLATLAELNQPSDVFKDGAGNIYIADKGNNKIRKVNTAGIISTIAGTGTAGYTGDGGPAVSATLKSPNRVVVDGAGNIYIADESNNVIRMVNTSGIISTLVTGLNDPTGVAVDLSGNIFISNHGTSTILKVTPAGVRSTYAGGGGPGFTVDGVAATSVSLCGQNYVSVDNAGTIYITNWSCWHFLKVTTAGLIYNVAGYMSPSYSGDCGPADSADIHFPFGICPDNLGNVYVCPQGNIRVRKVNTLNYITTVAGNGVAGYSGDGGSALSATVSSTIDGVYADMLGNIYFADMGNNVIRNFTSAPYIDSVSVCLGGTVTLSDANAGGSWSSGNTTVATIGVATGVVTGVSAGISIVTYNNIACPGLFFVSVVSPAITGGPSVCEGSTTTLSSGTTGGGTWSSSNTAVATAGPATGIITGVSTGTATITYSAPGGCFTTIPLTIILADSTFQKQDTSVCINIGSATLTAPLGYSSYIWNTGGTTSSIMVNTAGSYVVYCDIGCSVLADTFNFSITPNDTAYSHKDTSICVLLDSATLTAPPGYTSYLWSTGNTTSSIVANATGNYIAYSETGCNVLADTFHFSLTAIDTSVIHVDTMACSFNNTISLNAPPGYSAYTWSTGSAGSSITVSAAGSYIVYGATGCNELVDTFDYTILQPDTTFMHEDTVMCAIDGIGILIAPAGYNTFLWSNNDDSTSSTPITTSGSYLLYAANGCNILADTYNVTLHPTPAVTINASALSNTNGSYLYVLFSPQPSPNTYLWNNGSTDSTITVAAAGTYWLTVTNQWGCAATDSVYIADTLGDQIYIPNAFAPNGANTIFKLIIKGTVTLHYFRIFNRWGAVVFETNNTNEGWDGKYKGVPQIEDVYVYQYEAVLNNGTTVRKHGNVTLIR